MLCDVLGSSFAGFALTKSWTPDEDEALKHAIDRGISLQRLTVRFRRPRASILNRLKRLGLATAPVTRLGPVERDPASRPRKR